MKHEISFYQGTGNSYQVDLVSLVHNKNFNFLIDTSVNEEYYFKDYITKADVIEAHKKFSKKSSNKVNNKIVPINEMTAKEIVAGADRARLQRSKDKRIICRFAGVTPGRGWIKFVVNSQYTLGKHYVVYIKLKEANSLKYFKEFKKTEIIRLFLSGDLQMKCTCLRKGTTVRLLDGTTPTIEDVVRRYNSGEQLWVYSVDEDGNFKPGKVTNAFKSGVSKRFIRVTLDNGQVIETTENHLFMLRDGTYTKAANLQPGVSLMPVYTLKHSSGYELVKFFKQGDMYKSEYRSVYKEVAKEVFSQDMWEDAKDRSGEDCVVVHHIDYNKENNNPNNLRLMGKNEHIRFHANFLKNRLENDPVFREKMIKGVRNHIKKLNANPTAAMISQREKWAQEGRDVCSTDAWKKRQSSIMREVINRYWDSLTPEERTKRQNEIIKNNPELKKRQSDIRKKYWGKFTKEEIAKKNKNSIKAMTDAAVKKIKSMSQEEKDARYKSMVATRYKKILDKMAIDGVVVSEENFLSNFSKQKVSKGKKSGNMYGKYFKTFEDILKYLGEPYLNYNHKVVKVEVVECTSDEDVFDISVDKYHNFCLGAGVVVHNCADFRYRFSYMTWQLGYGLMKELRYPHIVNPQLKGSICKHCLAVLRVLQFNASSIAKQITKTKFYKRKAEELEENIIPSKIKKSKVRNKPK